MIWDAVRTLVGMIYYLVGPPLEVGAGDASGVASGLFALGDGVTCGGAAMLNISPSCFRVAFCLYPDGVSGLVGFGLKRVWVRSVVECFSVSFDEIIGSDRNSGKFRCVRESLFSSVGGVGC